MQCSYLNKIVKISIEIVAIFIRYSGIPLIVRNVYARNKVAIVMYHDPEPLTFSKHMKYLSKHYNIITLNQLVDAIYSKKWDGIPRNSLVITIDDGHKGNYDLLNIIKKYNIRPTIYICSQLVNTNRRFWFNVDLLNRNQLKKLSNEQRLWYLHENYGFELTKKYKDNERQALDNIELNDMKYYVDFQSHTRFHPILTTCSNDECEKEIYLSKREIERMLECECRHFSYPNNNYTGREIELVKKAGYLSARTVDVGWNDMKTDPYKLKITGVADDASINLLVAQLSGVTRYLRYVGEKITKVIFQRAEHGSSLKRPHTKLNKV